MKKSVNLLIFLFFFVCHEAYAFTLQTELAARLEPKYKNLVFIGSGSYGAVFESGDHVVKVSPLLDDHATLTNILEAALLSSLDHKSIPVPLAIEIHSGQHDSFLEIHLPHYETLPVNPIFMLQKMASVLSYLHGLNIAHRDIKPAHILKNGDSLVLIDLGCADIFTADPINECGTTMSYRSPESLNKIYDNPQKIDIWASAVAIAEFNQKKRIFMGETRASVWHEVERLLDNRPLKHNNIKGLNFLIAEMDLKEYAKLFKLMWHKDPQVRLSSHKLKAEMSVDDMIFALPNTPKNLFLDSPDITPRSRRVLYAWLFQIILREGFSDKVFFEAMSISDKFIQTSKLNHEHTEFFALVALYIAAGFYEQFISIDDIKNYSEIPLPNSEFTKLMLKLLINADFKIISSHTLRENQNYLYARLDAHDRNAAILVLIMLEIYEKTFHFSNQYKWSIAQAVLSQNLSRTNKSALKLIKRLCSKLKNYIISDSEHCQPLLERIELSLERYKN